MFSAFTVENMRQADLDAVRSVLDSTGLFPAEMLDDMAQPYLRADAPHHWLIARDEGGRLVGFAYAEPERLTDGTVNLLAIAVHRANQNQGVGKALVAGLIGRLAEMRQRVLLVETSGLEEYASTRGFYARLGFTQEARIRDFYRDGEDKIVFWLRIQPGRGVPSGA